MAESEESRSAVAIADAGLPEAGDPAPPSSRRRTLPRPSRRVLAAGAGSAVLLAAGLLITSLQSPLAIGALTIEGAGPDLQPAVAATIPVAVGEPLRTVDPDALSAQIGALDGVASASVGWAWWNTLSVVVVEQTPVGAVASRGGFTVLDAAGEPIRQVAQRPAGLPLIEAPSPAARQSALGAAQQLTPGLLGQTDAVIVSAGGALQLRLTAGGTVEFGSVDDLSEKLALLEQLLPIGAQHYNLTVPERPAVQGIPEPTQP